MALIIGATVPAGVAMAQGGQWWHDSWRMSDVWQVSDGTGITVAVIDTGVDASIPDLAGAVAPGINLIEGETDTNDYDGHGTAMASLIASSGEASGITGVAPGATIVPVVVDDGAQGSQDVNAQEAEAIRSAVHFGAHVINISTGTTNPEPCTDDVAAAIRYALSEGTAVVASSGNQADGPTESPGACPGVLTVGATTPESAPWEESHRSQFVDVAAPGTDIPALSPGGRASVADGTSNSTALVSGVVALVWAEFPDASAYEVVARILATVQDVGESGRDDATGHGMVRPYEALTADVPADAPNPVFDSAGDLTDVDPPSPDPTAFDAGEAPNFGAPPSADDDGPAIGPIVAIAAAGGLLAIVAAVVIAIVVARSRRRQQPHPYPPGPPPPYRPGPPGPPR